MMLGGKLQIKILSVDQFLPMNQDFVYIGNSDSSFSTCQNEGAELIKVDQPMVNDWLAKQDAGPVWIGATDKVIYPSLCSLNIQPVFFLVETMSGISKPHCCCLTVYAG